MNKSSILNRHNYQRGLNFCFAWGVLLCLLWSGFANAGYPSHKDDFINDFANVLQPMDSQILRDKLQNVEKQTGIEGVVVTINSIAEYDTGDNSIESFATHLFNNWGIGHKDRNNGFMVLVSVKDRKCRIELGGGYPSQYNSRMKEIIDETMIPRFKGEDYSRGIYDGTTQVIDSLTRKVSWLEYHKWEVGLGVATVLFLLAGISCLKNGRTGWGWIFFMIAGGFLISLITLLLSGNKEKSGFGGGSSSGGGASGSW